MPLIPGAPSVLQMRVLPLIALLTVAAVAMVACAFIIPNGQ